MSSMLAEDALESMSATQTHSAAAGDAPPSISGASATNVGVATLVGQRVGKYKVLREIGRGGMGAVYEAVHESIGQHIAIKTLNEELSSDARHTARFFDEARAVNIVQHPGLVRVFDHGHLENGTAYISMEFLQGESLQDRLSRLRKKNERLPLHESLRISRQIGSALEAVHEKGIAHRDLKPGNLYIVPDQEAPGGERVKVLDFGIAKFFGSPDLQNAGADVERHLTTVGKLLGTPVYMSPEQCSGAESIDDRIDVYALGVIMYQMLAGRLPFEAPAACVIMTKHIMEPPPPLTTVAPGLPEDVCALVHEMLAKSPKERPSMPQVVIRLEQILAQDAALSTGDWRSVHRSRMVLPRKQPVVLYVGIFLALSSSLLGVGVYRRTQRRAAAQAAAQTAAAAARLAAQQAAAEQAAAAARTPPPVPTPAVATTVPGAAAGAGASVPAATAAAPTAGTPVAGNDGAQKGSTKPARKKSGAKAKAKSEGEAAGGSGGGAGGGSDIPILR